MSGEHDDETPDAASRAAGEADAAAPAPQRGREPADAPAPERGHEPAAAAPGPEREPERAREPETLFELTDPPTPPAAAQQYAAESAAPEAPTTGAPAPPAPPAGAAPPQAPARASTRLGDDLSVFEDDAQDAADDDESPRLPGTHRGGFRRLPTAPVAVVIETAPAEPGTEEDAAAGQWLTRPPAPQRGLAGWALAFSIAGLVGSLFIGWGFPIGLVGAISAILALRRPLESRGVAIWALVLGLVSVLYSAGWLWWAATQANLLG